MISGGCLIGVDGLFDCGFNKLNIVRIKGQRKVIFHQKPCYVENVREGDVFVKNNVMLLIGNMKIHAETETLITIQKGEGLAIFTNYDLC